MTPLALGLLALLFAGPAPVLLTKARWPERVPRAAIVLWQALALGTVLAALGAGLALGLEILTMPRPSPLEIVLHGLVTTLTCVLAAWIVWSGVRVAVRTRARRRRHRDLVDLLATPDVRDPHLRVLSEQTPFAYCVPGVRDSRVVLSSGALEQLSTHELVAVLAHERAHLRARHDLVLEGFTALRDAFPGVGGRTPLEHSALLVEMLADDVARRRVGARALARALVTLAGTRAPGGALAASDTGTLARVRRLAEPDRPYRLLATTTYLAAVAVIALPTAFVAVPWLTRLAGLL